MALRFSVVVSVLAVLLLPMASQTALASEEASECWADVTYREGTKGDFSWPPVETHSSKERILVIADVTSLETITSPRISEDFPRILHSLRHHAKNGEGMAALMLGDIYHLGHRIAKNDAMALACYRLAHGLGVGIAERRYRGVVKPIEGYTNDDPILDRYGHPFSQHFDSIFADVLIHAIGSKRAELERYLAAGPELAPANDDAVENIYRALAEKGYADAQFSLGALLKRQGNKEGAKRWLLRALEGGELRAVAPLSELYTPDSELVVAKAIFGLIGKPVKDDAPRLLALPPPSSNPMERLQALLLRLGKVPDPESYLPLILQTARAAMAEGNSEAPALLSMMFDNPRNKKIHDGVAAYRWKKGAALTEDFFANLVDLSAWYSQAYDPANDDQFKPIYAEKINSFQATVFDKEQTELDKYFDYLDVITDDQSLLWDPLLHLLISDRAGRYSGYDGGESAIREKGKFLLAHYPQEGLITAIKALTYAAEQGDAEAAYYLANAYAVAPRKDYERIRTWLEKAYKGGYTKAAFILSQLYAHGKGVGKSKSDANAWLKKAAEGGDPEGQYYWAWVLLKGDGVEQDITRGWSLMREAALAEFGHAQLAIGARYLGAYKAFEGSDQAEVDAEYARVWIRRAFKNGAPNAEGMLNKIGWW